MDVQLLTQADYVLSKCGRPEPPPGVALAAVYIPESFLVQQVFPANAGTPTQTITKEIVGDAPWCLRSMQITSSTATTVSLQILKPDGRFLINQLQDLLQIAGYGSYRYLWNVEQQCPPGSKIQVTFQVTNTAQAQPVAILFEGAYLYAVKSGATRVCPNLELAGTLPRIFGTVNENIWAPAWQQGIAETCPPGYFDEEWTYSPITPVNLATGIPSTAISVTAANVTATQQFQIPPNEEAHIRRLLVAVQADAGVTSGTFLVKVRDDSGYALFDDYLDATLIGSAPVPRNWIVAPSAGVFADLQLVDQGGVGNMYFCLFLEGFRRRKASA